ncbi:hypothetical protein Droror1_Dr00025964 [Drosera rotundifolia]
MKTGKPGSPGIAALLIVGVMLLSTALLFQTSRNNSSSMRPILSTQEMCHQLKLNLELCKRVQRDQEQRTNASGSRGRMMIAEQDYDDPGHNPHHDPRPPPAVGNSANNVKAVIKGGDVSKRMAIETNDYPEPGPDPLHNPPPIVD